jgi:hypothetical protein
MRNYIEKVYSHMILLAWLGCLAAALTAKEVCVGEWEVYNGTLTTYGTNSPYYFEFHPSKAKRSVIVATIWHNGQTPQLLFQDDNALVEQLKLEFTSPDSGRATGQDGTAVPFSFDTTETDTLVASVTLPSSLGLRITILSNVGIQIDVPGRGLTFVAFYQQPIASRRRATRNVAATESGPPSAAKERPKSAGIGPQSTILLVVCAVGSVLVLAWLLINKKRPAKVKAE